MNGFYEVYNIDCPRFYDDEVSFRVHWTDGTCSREPIKNLIPGCKYLIAKWLYDNCAITTEKLNSEILKHLI